MGIAVANPRPSFSSCSPEGEHPRVFVHAGKENRGLHGEHPIGEMGTLAGTPIVDGS
jgi:hypothetical protein